MRVLLITSKDEDYLQDSIIHGFKKLYGKDAIDYPVKNILYNDYEDLKKIRGNGFTLYGLLDARLKPDCKIDLEKDILNKKFELIVFTSIYRQFELFYDCARLFLKNSIPVWIMDGEDSPVLFPYLRKHLKFFLWSTKPHKHFIYFKRELLPETLSSIYLRLPVNKFGKTSFPKNIKPISFSIPDEKIIKQLPIKTKLFTKHIVDGEVANKVYGQTQHKLFDTESEYYGDIQASKFGITTKRAGWDCLRHYEIAANGAIMCFKDLNVKPDSCAPHGLIAGYNCIGYSNYNDLISQIENISLINYQELLKRAFEWVTKQSTISRVKKLLADFAS